MTRWNESESDLQRGLDSPDSSEWPGLVDLAANEEDTNTQLSPDLFPPEAKPVKPPGSNDGFAVEEKAEDKTVWEVIHAGMGSASNGLAIMFDTSIRQRSAVQGQAEQPKSLSQSLRTVGQKGLVVGIPWGVRMGLDATLFKNKETTAITTITDIVSPFVALALLPKIGSLRAVGYSILAHVAARNQEDEKSEQ